MALGTTVLFDLAVGAIFDAKLIDMNTDTFDCMLITDAAVPSRDTAIAKSTYTEVSAGSYAEDANIGNTWGENANVWEWNANNAVFPYDASGPTDIEWAIVYDESDTTTPDACLTFTDLVGPKTTQDGDLTVKWSNGATDGIVFDVTMT